MTEQRRLRQADSRFVLKLAAIASIRSSARFVADSVLSRRTRQKTAANARG